MLGSPCRLATCCNTACGRPFRHHRSFFADDPPSPCSPAVAARGRRAGRRRVRRRRQLRRRGGLVQHRRQRAADADVHRREGGQVGQPRPQARRSRRRAASRSSTGPVSISLEGPVPDAGRRQAAEVQARRGDRGRRPEHPGGRDVDRREGLRLVPGHRLRASTTRSSSSSRPASRRPRRTARTRSQSFASLGMDPRKWLTDPKNEGEAKVGDDDTIKITGGVDVAKLLDDVNTALGKAVVARAPGRRPGAGEADRRAAPAGARRRQGPARGDLHRQGRPDPAPDGRQPRRRGRRRAAPAAPSRSTSRSPTSTRTRTSPSRRTPSRSTSCSASSAGSASAGGAAGSGSGSGVGRRRRGSGRGPREVLEVHRGRRRGRREGAQVLRADRGLNDTL